MKRFIHKQVTWQRAENFSVALKMQRVSSIKLENIRERGKKVQIHNVTYGIN